MPDDLAILQEQERLISGLKPPQPIIFRSNHASNALALAGNLPKDKEKLLLQTARSDGRASSAAAILYARTLRLNESSVRVSLMELLAIRLSSQASKSLVMSNHEWRIHSA